MVKRKKFDLTREEALRIIMRATDQEAGWEEWVEDFYDEETDSMPSIYEVLKPFGITEEEINSAG